MKCVSYDSIVLNVPYTIFINAIYSRVVKGEKNENEKKNGIILVDKCLSHSLYMYTTHSYIQHVR